MKTSSEIKHAIELEALQNSLYESIPPSIREAIDKPYKCEICGKRFKVSKYVHKHKVEVHAY